LTLWKPSIERVVIFLPQELKTKSREESPRSKREVGRTSTTSKLIRRMMRKPSKFLTIPKTMASIKLKKPMMKMTKRK
jgi:ribonuclease PH